MNGSPPHDLNRIEFDMPEASEPRHVGGWIILFIIFGLMVTMEWVQYMDRGTEPKNKYSEPLQQLRFAIVMKEAGRKLGGEAPGMERGVQDVAEDLKQDATKNRDAARIFAAAKSELKEPVPEPVTQLLRSSESKGDRLLAEVFAAKKLTPERAQEIESALDGNGFLHRLARTQAREKAGDDSLRKNFVSNQEALAKFAAIGGMFLTLGLGICLLIIYFVLKANGKLPSIGMPLERISAADADRLALRCAQVLMAFLGVQIVVPLLLKSTGLSIDKYLATIAIYILMIGAVLWLFRFPIGGKRFSLRSIGIHSNELGKNVLWGFGTAIANMPIVLLLGVLSQKLFAGLPGAEHPTTVEIQTGVGFLGMTAIFFAASIGAPIIEEIMFRGTLLPAMARVLRRPVVAILLQGLIFAAIHPTGLPAWLPLAAIGSTSGFLSRQTGSLVPSIVMHAVHNFGTLIFATAMFS